MLPLKKPLLDPGWLLFHRFSLICMIPGVGCLAVFANEILPSMKPSLDFSWLLSSIQRSIDKSILVVGLAGCWPGGRRRGYERLLIRSSLEELGGIYGLFYARTNLLKNFVSEYYHARTNLRKSLISGLYHARINLLGQSVSEYLIFTQS